MAEDSELLGAYVRDGSQQAFGELVAKHLDLVYGSARRQVRNDALAEDVTQAVFLMLARKASSLRADVIVPGWLMTATWYACKNALRKERRRRIHEAGVASMRRETAAAEPSSDPAEISRVLDEALAKLGDRDRGAVTMRFLQGRSFREVGVPLGVSEEAAHKRVTRALEKLRAVFRRGGVTMESEALAGGLSRQAAQLAPAGLLAAVFVTVSGAVTASAAAGGTGVAADVIAEAALQAMSAAARAKLAATLAVAMLLIGGIGAAVTATASRFTAVDAAAPAAATLPASENLAPRPLVRVDFDAGGAFIAAGTLTFPNAVIAPNSTANITQYEFGMDNQVVRRREGEPSAFIASLPTDRGIGPMPGMRGWFVSALAWRGKRVEFSAYLRTQDVAKAAGLNVLVWGAQNRLLADDMNGGPLRIAGTRDWTRIASVLDVPEEAQRIEFGVGLWGPGRLWLDSFTIAVVPQTAPVTSDSLWHLSTQSPSKYHLISDPSQPRNGHATARLESVSAALGSDESATLTRTERALEGLRGQRVRIRAFIKPQSVTAGAGIVAAAGHFGAGRRFIQKAANRDLPVRGTTGWMRYAVTLDVPAEADMLEYGVRLQGAGTVWMDDITVEVVQ